MQRAVTALALCVLFLTSAATAMAQDQPAGAPSDTTTQPPGEGFVAKARRFADENAFIKRMFGDGDGIYIRFGGMTTGSGIGLGPGYRRHVANNKIFVDVSAGLSTKLYKTVDANVRWLQLFGDRLEVWSDFRYQDYPEEDFFGLGLDSVLEQRANYDLDSTDIVGRGLIRIMPWLEVGADIGYFNPTISRGRDRNYPTIGDVFDDLVAAGLLVQPNFLHNTMYAEVDYRDRPGSPTKGGNYRASFGRWNDVTVDRFDFHRFDADVAQFVSPYPRHVLGGHVGLSYVNNATGHRVPFYFLPYVGGSDTLRGYREFRFREENILFTNIEYRYQAHKAVDLALFVDAGEVREDWEDIDFSALKTSYGFGIRVHGDKRTFLRLDFGFGSSEGMRFFFKLGPSF
jgi:outer membrane protein assembly factor BamA